MLQHAVPAIFFLFLVMVPLCSITISPFLVVFNNKNSEIGRSDFQNKLILRLGLTLVFSILGKLGYLGMPTAAVLPDMTIVKTNLSIISTVFIPAVLYSFCLRNAGKRLQGMGYSRFFSLLGVLPLAGPMLLVWLALTIRERQTAE